MAEVVRQIFNFQASKEGMYRLRRAGTLFQLFQVPLSIEQDAEVSIVLQRLDAQAGCKNVHGTLLMRKRNRLANWEPPDGISTSLLCRAIKSGAIESVGALCRIGAFVDTCDASGRTVFHLIAMLSGMELDNMVEARGGSGSISHDALRLMLLTTVLENSNPSVVKNTVGFRDKHGQSCLDRAMANRSVAPGFVERLLASGCDVTALPGKMPPILRSWNWKTPSSFPRTTLYGRERALLKMIPLLLHDKEKRSGMAVLGTYSSQEGSISALERLVGQVRETGEGSALELAFLQLIYVLFSTRCVLTARVGVFSPLIVSVERPLLWMPQARSKLLHVLLSYKRAKISGGLFGMVPEWAVKIILENLFCFPNCTDRIKLPPPPPFCDGRSLNHTEAPWRNLLEM